MSFALYMDHHVDEAITAALPVTTSRGFATSVEATGATRWARIGCASFEIPSTKLLCNYRNRQKCLRVVRSGLSPGWRIAREHAG